MTSHFPQRSYAAVFEIILVFIAREQQYKQNNMQHGTQLS